MSDYPVKVTYAPDEGQNRLWGIPLAGAIVRSILCIPQAIIIVVLAIVLYFVILLNWIPILFNGRQAGWVYAVAGGYLRISTRVAAYILLITGRYPPFGPGGDHTVSLTFDQSETQNRLWGIPFIGLVVRWILLIPHFLVLFVLAIVAGVLMLFTWVPVLLNGRTADWVVRWVGGFYRWSVQVSAYAFLLTGKYPPFSLDDQRACGSSPAPTRGQLSAGAQAPDSSARVACRRSFVSRRPFAPSCDRRTIIWQRLTPRVDRLAAPVR